MDQFGCCVEIGALVPKGRVLTSTMKLYGVPFEAGATTGWSFVALVAVQNVSFYLRQMTFK
jgi:hypothetical protein